MFVLGPCPTCGKMFESRYSKKIFCSIKCYGKSDQLKKMLAKNNKKKKAGIKNPDKICLNCGKSFYTKPSANSKYCCHLCYRTYMSKRFDRKIATPDDFINMQNYDEYLIQNELPCLIKGCNWKGRHLSLHMNLAHGIRAEEFKEIAGFNRETGVIGKSLHEELCDRDHIHLPKEYFNKNYVRKKNFKRKDIRKEGKEHYEKARLLLENTKSIDEHICLKCGKVFLKKSVLGIKKYCSIECRTKYLTEKHEVKNIELVCDCCEKEFLGNKAQKRRVDKGLPVFCSPYCRQKRAGHIARGTWNKK
jgi:hypothetical protein